MAIKTCIDCPDRTVEPNCHDTCEKYIAFKEEVEKIRKNRQDAYAVETARAIRHQRGRHQP